MAAYVLTDSAVIEALARGAARWAERLFNQPLHSRIATTTIVVQSSGIVDVKRAADSS